MKKETAIALGVAAIAGILLVTRARAAPPPEGYCCPYNTAHGCFDTYDELVAHIQTVHPGERIPIDIEWD